jgi:hypothetical protein
MGFVIYDDFWGALYVTGFAYSLGVDGNWYLISTFGKKEDDEYNYSRKWDYNRELGKPAWRRWFDKLRRREA